MTKLTVRRLGVAVLAGLMPIAAHAFPANNDHVIYGDDDRLNLYEVQDHRLLELADSTVALFKAANVKIEGAVAKLTTKSLATELNLCKEERFYEEQTGAFCSGFLVGSDLMLTAGHCVVDQAACEGTKFVFGFAIKQEHQLPSSVPAGEVYGCKKLVKRTQDAHGADFALVKLDREVSNHAFVRAASTQNIAVNTPLVMIGHPSGLPVKVAGGANVRSTDNPGFFVANTDSYGGNSGSAVFNAETGLVEGILVRGEADYVTNSEKHCRESKRCENSACRGEDITKISAVGALTDSG